MLCVVVWWLRFDVRCVLFVECSLLFVVCCLLIVAACCLLRFWGLLSLVCCLSVAENCSLLLVRRVLFAVVRCMLLVV